MVYMLSKKMTPVAYLYSERATAQEVAEFVKRAMSMGLTKFVEDGERFNLLALPETYPDDWVEDLINVVIPTGAMLQEDVWQGKDISGKRLYEEYSVWEVNKVERMGDDNRAIIRKQNDKDIYLLFIDNPYVRNPR
ncbi:DNA topoisomerase [Bacillus phage Shanette]|uniref:DNA topoisomerase n=1 Tax=Bacillus phage Shanette TaxID=1296656 RepID=S5M5B4_9CAUD|nr:DNA topoisomerase [Bacillus phage Shanette]AGR47121.1 DNA topoisomerase [Bacillus phage Shanette]